MKRLFSVLTVALYVTAAHAEKADSEKPTNIEADQMAYDDVKQINTFTGNVVLTRGTLLMKAQKLIVTQDPAGYQFATLIAPAGGVATFRQKRDGGNNQWVEGQAERIEYDGKAEVVKLFLKAKMRRLEGNTPTDEVEGEFISYDSGCSRLAEKLRCAPSGARCVAGSGVRRSSRPARTEWCR